MAAPATTFDAATARVAAAFDFSGRHALVTGAGSAIGAAVARALARAGARVTACGEGVTDLARDLAALGAAHAVLDVDVSTVEGRGALVARCGGTLDIVVTCAAEPEPVTMAELTGTGWRAALDGVVTAAALVTRDVLASLRHDGDGPGGCIVHIGSTRGLRGEAGAAALAAAAAGLGGLTRSLARELGPRGVRVNMVAAGPVAAGRADKVAALALFLASDDAAGINGETLVADGGG